MNQAKVKQVVKRLIREGGLLNTLRALYDVVAALDGSKKLPARAIKKARDKYKKWYLKKK